MSKTKIAKDTMLDERNKGVMSDNETRSDAEVDKVPQAIKSSVTIDGLDQIKTPNTDLIIWHRTLPARLHNWIKSLPASYLPKLRVLVAPCDLNSALDPMLDACGLPNNDMRDFMVNDISALVRKFSFISETEMVDVRLEHIDHDSCWRFHTDVVDLRLLTSYLGKGTEWVKPIHAQNAINDQKQYSGPIERLELNEVGIFKGKRSLDTNGIVHRSPPVEDSGNSRLLLCLNKRTEVSPPPWNKD